MRNGPAPKTSITILSPTKDIPKAPNWLSVSAKKEWKIIVKYLCSVGLYKQCDENTLAMGIQSFSNYKGCQRIINETGRTYESKGRIYKRPENELSNKYFSEANQIFKAYGLDPESRMKLNIQSDDSDDELEKFLSNGG